MLPPEPLTRLPPSYFVRGDNASARYKPEHGVHAHGQLRGLLGGGFMTLDDRCRVARNFKSKVAFALY